MNAKVEKKINGLAVSANPIFKGGVLPAYWACEINDRMIPKTFEFCERSLSLCRKPENSLSLQVMIKYRLL